MKQRAPRMPHEPANSLPADSSAERTAAHFYVDDLPGATIPSSRFQNILASIRLGKPLTRLSLAFLEQRGFHALHQLASSELTYHAYREIALYERSLRIELKQAARKAQEAEMQTKWKLAEERAEAARRAQQRDPKYIAKARNQELRARYGVDTYTDEHCFSRLMKIVKCVDAGRRLGDADVVWLSTIAEEYFSDQLRVAYHRLEAEHFADEFARIRTPGRSSTPAATTASAIRQTRPATCSGASTSICRGQRSSRPLSAPPMAGSCVTSNGGTKP